MKSRLFVRAVLFFAFALFFSTRAQLGPPSNDDFANRTLLEGVNFSFSGRTYNATEEPNENLVSAFSEASVWWKWISPTDGIVTIQANTFDFGYEELGIFRGSAPFTNFQLSNNLARLDGYSGPFTNFRVRTRQEYSFGLFGYRYSQNTSSFTVSIAEMPEAPVNDSFGRRLDLVGSSVAFGGSTIGASMEPGEDTPSYATDNDASRWWKWTAPNDGFATLSFSEPPLVSVQTPFVRILRGPDLVSLTYVATLSPLSSGPTVFRARTGETFSFQMRGRASTNIAINMKLELANLPEAPPNDAFANRTVLQGSSFNFSGNLYGSSYEPGETFPYAADQSFRSGSIWWTWTAPNDGYADVVIPATFTGESAFWMFKNAPTISNLGSNIAQVTKLSPLTLSVRTQPGETFVFGISGRAHTNVTHQFALTTRSLAPANDLFANPIILPPGSQEFVGTLFGSTKENGEPNLWTWSLSGGSTWWSWTPSASGFATLTFPDQPPYFGPETNPELHVSRGTTLETFASLENRVAYLNAREGYYAGFPVTGGQTYRIAMVGDSVTDISRRFTLTVSDSPIILGHPTSQVVKPGGAGLFSVFAPGAAWSDVRWQFNGVDLTNGSGTNILKATGPTLGVFNVTATNVGGYRAVITSGGISSTSLVATLSLNDVERRPSIRLSHAAETTNDFSAQVDGETNQFYLLQGSDDLQTWRSVQFTGPMGWQIKSSGMAKIRAEELSWYSMFFRAARRGDLRDACVVNLRRMDLAKEAWKVLYRKMSGSIVQESEVEKFFEDGRTPRCPQGGTYTYGSLDSPPSCSLQFEGHSL
jgi:hypothetical protein